MIRLSLCYLFVLVFSFYAYRRWFVSLCAAVVLMSVLEHPDMPKSIAGIQGLNPWNFLMANVLFAWWSDKSRSQRQLDWPPGVLRLLVLFVALILVSAARLLVDPGVLGAEQTTGAMVSEYIVNCVKWLLPAVLMFDGCRDRQNVHLAIISILALYFLLAVQTIRWMPLGMITSGDDLSARASKITQNEIGYNRVTLSMLLAGASWATLSTLTLVRGWRWRTVVCAAAAAMMLGQALTGGRTGYVTWLAVGMLLCAVRWRKLLLIIPVMVMLILTFVPQVRDRMLQGIVGTETGEIDEYAMTSGRNLAWPHVIDAIKESPVTGYGRQAMSTTGIRDQLWTELGESFPHPHNAYLEVWLDNGVIGLAIVLLLFLTLFYRSLRLLRDREDPVATAVGGLCLSLVAALMLGSLGGQTFYPREGSVGMWAAIGLMLRVYVDRTALRYSEAPAEAAVLHPESQPFSSIPTQPV